MRIVAIRGIRFPVADGPAAGRIFGFVEPAVQDAHVQRAVDAGLHAAGARGFFPAARRVQPDVHAAHQFARHLNRVILHEHHPPGEFRIARELHDFADQRLARYVLGMGFPRDHQLHRPGGVAQDALEPSQVPENQRGPFVSGEAAREPDGQRFRIQNLLQAPDFGRRCIAGHRAGDHAFPHERHHAPFSAAVRLPQFRVRNVGDLLPDFRLGVPFAPIRLQVLVVERGEIAIDPGGKMHAVGDGGDGDFPDREFGPQSFPHVLRNDPVQAADRVPVGGSLDGRDGHGKRFLLILRIAAPQAP